MNQGYIKLFRSIEDWEWIDEPVMFYFWGRILLMANWEEKRWHGEVVERGSFITSLSNLSEHLHLSVQQVRTCLSRLQFNKQIYLDSTNKRTKVTICKYEDYQGCVTNEQQTNNTQANKRTTTTKEVYNTSDTKVSSYSIQEEKKKKEGDTDVSPKKAPSDFDFVLQLWNSSMRRVVPKVRMLSPARKEKVRLRIKEMGGMDKARETLTECFRKIDESDFCNGSNAPQWVASFDWFFDNEKNWMKVLEGNYDNKKTASRIEQYADTSKKAKDLLSILYGSGNERTTDGFGDTPDEQ